VTVREPVRFLSFALPDTRMLSGTGETLPNGWSNEAVPRRQTGLIDTRRDRLPANSDMRGGA
jgi:hypothetical protein